MTTELKMKRHELVGDSDLDYRLANSTQDFEDYINEFKDSDVSGLKWMGIDTETTGLNVRKDSLVGFSISLYPKTSIYVPVGHELGTNVNWEVAARVLQDLINDRVCLFWNAKFDISILERNMGIEFKDLQVLDVMCLYYLLNCAQKNFGLKYIAGEYIAFKMDKFESLFEDQLLTKTGTLAKNRKIKNWNIAIKSPLECVHYACLHKNSLVELEDGSWDKISKLVKNKYSGKVKSYNTETNKIEYRKVTNWYRNDVGQKSWKQLITNTTEYSKHGTPKAPVFTPDHMVRTQHGYEEVQSLINDYSKIVTDEKTFSKEQLSVFLGSMLGDGGLESKNGRKTSFHWSQCVRRSSYADWKADVFSTHNPVCFRDNKFKSYKINYNKYLTFLKNKYPRYLSSSHRERKLVITNDLLNDLGDLGLAVWFMDDGVNAKTELRIIARKVSEKEKKIFINFMLYKHHINVKYNENNGFFVFQKENKNKFIDIIEKFVHPIFQYKIEKFIKYPYTVNKDGDIYLEKIKDVVNYYPPVSGRGYGVRYCIEVEGNHNFYTKSGLVKNCSDADATLRLGLNLYDYHLQVSETNLIQIDTYVMHLIRRIERDGGLEMNPDYVFKTKNWLEDSLTELQSQIDELLGYPLEISKVKEVEKALFDVKRLPVIEKTPKGTRSTNAKVLNQLAETSPLAEKILMWRKLEKARGTYIVKLVRLVDEGIKPYFTFLQCSTQTFRLSAAGGDPDKDGGLGINIQAVSKGSVRDIFGVDVTDNPLLNPEKTMDDVDIESDDDWIDELKIDGPMVSTASYDMPVFILPAGDDKDKLVCTKNTCEHCAFKCASYGINTERVKQKDVHTTTNIREAFRAPDGWTVAAFDYDREEIVIAANMSGEDVWLDAIESGTDIHNATAKSTFDLKMEVNDPNFPKHYRNAAKAINFGIIYGITEFGLAPRINMSIDEAKDVIYNKFFGSLKKLKKWMDDKVAFGRKYKYITTLMGRVRPLKELYESHPPDSRYPQRLTHADKTAINCVTDDTLIITKNGWTTCYELKIGDEALTVNKNTGEIEWDEIIDKNVSYIDNKIMIEIENNSISAISTPHHRWLVDRKKRGGVNTCTVTSENLSQHGDDRIWISGDKHEFKNNIWLDDEVELIGWFLTDGFISSDKTRIGVSQTKSQNINSLRILLNKFNCNKETYNKETKHYRWELKRDDSEKILNEFPSKILTMKFLSELNSYQLDLLFQTMLKGDGCWDKTNSVYKTFCAGTEEKANAFAMLCAMIGQSCRIFSRDFTGRKSYFKNPLTKQTYVRSTKPCFYVELKKRNRAYANIGYKEVGYTGNVWCPTLSKDGAWIAKREGKVYTSQNTPVQGTGGDLLRVAMSRVYLRLKKFDPYGDFIKPIASVHDEIVFIFRNDKIKESALFVKGCMEINVKSWRCQLQTGCSLGKLWGKLEEVDWDKLDDYEPEP